MNNQTAEVMKFVLGQFNASNSAADALAALRAAICDWQEIKMTLAERYLFLDLLHVFNEICCESEYMAELFFEAVGIVAKKVDLLVASDLSDSYVLQDISCIDKHCGNPYISQIWRPFYIRL